MNQKIISRDYWNDLYAANDTRWDIGFPSPAIQQYVDQLNDKKISILIPGCGNAYEAEYLLSQGFTNVTLIDIAPALTSQLEQKFKNIPAGNINIITGDFFEQAGKYQLILEQTFLSALEPSLRPAYAAQMHRLLNPGGHLAGVLFSQHFEQGPPYGGSVEEYKALFEKNFRIKTLENCYNSIDRRKGSEVFINLVAR
jgi:methyl halide transferase